MQAFFRSGLDDPPYVTIVIANGRLFLSCPIISARVHSSNSLPPFRFASIAVEQNQRRKLCKSTWDWLLPFSLGSTLCRFLKLENIFPRNFDLPEIGFFGVFNS